MSNKPSLSACNCAEKPRRRRCFFDDHRHAAASCRVDARDDAVRAVARKPRLDAPHLGHGSLRCASQSGFGMRSAFAALPAFASVFGLCRISQTQDDVATAARGHTIIDANLHGTTGKI